MATRRIMICDHCGKKEKKDCTGWVNLSINAHIFGKKGYWWSRKRKEDDYYLSKEFCGARCFDTYLNGLILSGKVIKKVNKLLETQKKEKDMK